MDPFACDLSVTDHFLCCQLISQKSWNVDFDIKWDECVLNIETFIRHEWVTRSHLCHSLNENMITSRPSICWCQIGHLSTRSDTYKDFQCVPPFVHRVWHLFGSWFFLNRNFQAIYDYPSARRLAFEVTGHVLIDQFPVRPYVQVQYRNSRLN